MFATHSQSTIEGTPKSKMLTTGEPGCKAYGNSMVLFLELLKS
jgi:hypothetical protein